MFTQFFMCEKMKVLYGFIMCVLLGKSNGRLYLHDN